MASEDILDGYPAQRLPVRAIIGNAVLVVIRSGMPVGRLKSPKTKQSWPTKASSCRWRLMFWKSAYRLIAKKYNRYRLTTPKVTLC